MGACRPWLAYSASALFKYSRGVMALSVKHFAFLADGQPERGADNIELIHPIGQPSDQLALHFRHHSF